MFAGQSDERECCSVVCTRLNSPLIKGDEMMCAGLWLDADSAMSVVIHVTLLRSRMGTEFVKPNHLLYIW